LINAINRSKAASMFCCRISTSAAANVACASPGAASASAGASAGWVVARCRKVICRIAPAASASFGLAARISWYAVSAASKSPLSRRSRACSSAGSACSACSRLPLSLPAVALSRESIHWRS